MKTFIRVSFCLLTSTCSTYSNGLGEGKPNARELACEMYVMRHESFFDSGPSDSFWSPIMHYNGHLNDRKAEWLISFNEFNASDDAEVMTKYAFRLNSDERDSFEKKECYIYAPLAMISRAALDLETDENDSSDKAGTPRKWILTQGALVGAIEPEFKFRYPININEVAVKCPMDNFWANYCAFEFSLKDVARYIDQQRPKDPQLDK
jgi:hypothetical protein